MCPVESNGPRNYDAASPPPPELCSQTQQAASEQQYRHWLGRLDVGRLEVVSNALEHEDWISIGRKKKDLEVKSCNAATDQINSKSRRLGTATIGLTQEQLTRKGKRASQGKVRRAVRHSNWRAA